MSLNLVRNEEGPETQNLSPSQFALLEAARAQGRGPGAQVAEESRAAARALLEHEWLAASGPSAASRLWSARGRGAPW